MRTFSWQMHFAASRSSLAQAVRNPYNGPVKKQTVAANPPAMPAGLRRYLYFTAAVTGAAIMIIEILGAKMLAPYVGTSHFISTAQLAVTLLALAAGYYAGGRMVDRSLKLARIYGCVLMAAIYLCLSVLIVK